MCAKSGSVPHAESTVDGDDRTRDVGRIVGGEETDNCCNIFRLSGPLQRDELGGLVLDVVAQCCRHVGLDETRCDDVGGDRTRAEFPCQGTSDTDDACLGRGVVDLAGLSRQTHHRTEEDEASETRAQHRPGRTLREAERTGEVRVDDARELLFAHSHDQCVVGDAGIGDDDLDRPLVRFDLFERTVDRLGVGDVANDAEQPSGTPEPRCVTATLWPSAASR